MSAATTHTILNTDGQRAPTSNSASTGTTLPGNENQWTSMLGTTVDARAPGTNDDDDSSEENDNELYMCKWVHKRTYYATATKYTLVRVLKNISFIFISSSIV